MSLVKVGNPISDGIVFMRKKVEKFEATLALLDSFSASRMVSLSILLYLTFVFYI